MERDADADHFVVRRGEALELTPSLRVSLGWASGPGSDLRAVRGSSSGFCIAEEAVEDRTGSTHAETRRGKGFWAVSGKLRTVSEGQSTLGSGRL